MDRKDKERQEKINQVVEKICSYGTTPRTLDGALEQEKNLKELDRLLPDVESAQEGSVSIELDGVIQNFDLPLSRRDYDLIVEAIRPVAIRPVSQSLAASLYKDAQVYASATDRHGLSIEDRVHGAVYRTLVKVEEIVHMQHSPPPYPFNTDLADDYADQRDAESSEQGRSLLQIDRDLFD